MKWNNLLLVLPKWIFEGNVFSWLLLILVIMGAIYALKNYLVAIKDVYTKSEYKEAKVMMVLDYFILILFLLLPVLFCIKLIISPYSFYKNSDNEVEICGYTGGEIMDIPSNVLFYKVVSIQEEAIKDNQDIKELIIPDSVKTIEEYAFSNCANLEKITFGKGTEVIKEAAFSDCSKLKEIYFNDNIKKIEAFVFANCNELSEIPDFSDDVAIGTGVFLNTKWLCNQKDDYVIIGNNHYILISERKSIKVPDGVLTVDFYLKDMVKKVVLPDSISEFPDYCFQGCSALYKMNVPYVHRGAYCFGGCYKLEESDVWLSSLCNVDYNKINIPFSINTEFINECRQSIN